MTTYNTIGHDGASSVIVTTRGSAVATVMHVSDDTPIDGWTGWGGEEYAPYNPALRFAGAILFCEAGLMRISNGGSLAIAEHGGKLLRVKLYADTALNGGAEGFFDRSEDDTTISWKYNHPSAGSLQFQWECAGVLATPAGVQVGTGFNNAANPTYFQSGHGVSITGNGRVKGSGVLFSFAAG
jgi:hypothetical protein